MNPRFLFIIVILVQNGDVFAQYSNDSLENTSDNDGVGLRIFGFEENTDECTRTAHTNKEKIIGITFQLLCRHFGPKARDKIIQSVKITKHHVPEKRAKFVFTHCLEKMKLKMMSCFEIIFDSYDLAGSESPPECLQNLTVFPEPKFQIFWLRKFSFVLEFLDRVIKGYKLFSPSRVVVETYLDQDIIEHWKNMSHFDYAETKIDEWDSSEVQNKNERLKKIIGQPSNLLDVCIFSSEWLRNPRDFEDNVCLRKIMGNILILEIYLQKAGVTLETEFIFGRFFLLHLLHVVKSVIRLRNIIPNTRRAMTGGQTPVYDMVAQVNEIKATNIQCLNELRRIYDQTGGKLSATMKTKKLQECLDAFVARAEKSSKPVKEAFLRQAHASTNGPMKNAEKEIIKAIIKSHSKMKPLQPVIQNMVDRGIPQPSAAYPWANQFLQTFNSSPIANNYAKLSNAHYSSSYSSSSSCKGGRNSIDKKRKCWGNYVTQNMIIEKQLQNRGLSMQQMYLGHPGRTNMIYYIDEAMRKNQLNNGRVIAQYRKFIPPKIDTEAIIEEVMTEPPDNETQRINQKSRRTLGQLDLSVADSGIDDSIKY